MSLYPTLEDMKVDQMIQVVYYFKIIESSNFILITQAQNEVFGAQVPPAPVQNASLPYPIHPGGGGAPVYPGLADFVRNFNF